VLHELAAYCVLSTVYCFMNLAIVKPMGHGSCIMGHGSIFVWVSGSWITAYDPLPALTGRLCAESTERFWRNFVSL